MGFVERDTAKVRTPPPVIYQEGTASRKARLHLLPYKYQLELVPRITNGDIVDPLPARFAFYAWGSKAGKTTSAILRASALLWGTQDRIYRWIAPFHRQSKIAETRLRKVLPEPAFKYRASERMIIGPQGTVLSFHSGDRPDTIPGEDCDGVILDEAARLKEDVFENSLSTVLATNGWIMAISTPTGRNYFYRHCQLGRKGTANHFFRHFPTTINSLFQSYEGKKNLQDTKDSLPDFVYRQLILAEFVAETQSVFPSLEPCSSPHLPQNRPTPGKVYIISVDVGQIVDYNVATVWDVYDGSLAHWWRQKGMDYVGVQANLGAYSRQWNDARVFVERNGPGLPIAQNLAAAGVPVGVGPDGNMGFAMTGGSKPALVHSWGLALRNREPILPEREPSIRGGSGWRELYEEHESYEYTITKSGNWTVSAPGGEDDHDDIVMSCLIGWWALGQNVLPPKFWRAGGGGGKSIGRRDRIIVNE